VRCRIETCSDHAQERVACARQVIVVDDVARTDQLDTRFIESTFSELPGERSGLSGRHEHEQRIGLKIARALQERSEVRIGTRHPQGIEDLAPAFDEMLFENLASLGARRPAERIQTAFLLPF
jgi:hypothetical protein